jgi:hypothetical protein
VLLDRVAGLGPEVSIFLLDTTLQIERNIIDNLRRLLDARAVQGSAVVRAGQGVYQARTPAPLFVVTSRRSLIANLERCLRRVRPAADARADAAAPTG